MRTQSIPVKWLDGGLASCRGPDQQDPHRNAALSKSRWGRQGMQQAGQARRVKSRECNSARDGGNGKMRESMLWRQSATDNNKLRQRE